MLSPPASVVCSTTVVSNVRVDRPLTVPGVFRARAGGTHTMAAGLLLEGARVPTSGGDFQFYLLDKQSGCAIFLGRLAILGPTHLKVGNLHFYVELNARALQIVRDIPDPTVRIVSGRMGDQPLQVGRITLTAA